MPERTWRRVLWVTVAAAGFAALLAWGLFSGSVAGCERAGTEAAPELRCALEVAAPRQEVWTAFVETEVPPTFRRFRPGTAAALYQFGSEEGDRVRNLLGTYRRWPSSGARCGLKAARLLRADLVGAVELLALLQARDDSPVDHLAAAADAAGAEGGETRNADLRLTYTR